MTELEMMQIQNLRHAVERNKNSESYSEELNQKLIAATNAKFAKGESIKTKEKQEKLIQAAKDMLEMWDYICARVNWGEAFLDTKAINMWDECPAKLEMAIKELQEES